MCVCGCVCLGIFVEIFCGEMEIFIPAGYQAHQLQNYCGNCVQIVRTQGSEFIQGSSTCLHVYKCHKPSQTNRVTSSWGSILW